MNYEKLYLKTFQKNVKDFELKIKLQLEKHKSLGKRYDFARKNIINDLRKDYGKLKIESSPYVVMIGDFDSRLEEFEPEQQMRIISTSLHKKFNQNNIDESYNYASFLEELALINYRSKIINLLNGNINLSRNYYSLHQIENISLVVSPFESWILHSNSNNTQDGLIVTNKEPIKCFTISEKYNTLFDKENSSFYSRLTDDFINSELTSEEDFNNVFTTPFEDHNSEVHFFCTSQLAAVLLSNLKLISKSLTAVNIGRSSLFRTSNNTIFTADNIAQSKGNASTEDIKFANTFLDKFIII